MIEKINEVGVFIWKIFFIMILLLLLLVFYLIGFGIYEIFNLIGGWK